jgi:hypothetical protein
MLRKGIVDNVVVLCGSNENELHKQLTIDHAERSAKFVDEYMSDLPFFLNSSVKTQLKAQVKIYKSSDLSSTPPISNKTLVIWDESHFAQRIGNLPEKFLTNSGLKVDAKETSDSMWEAKSSYFMSVSATGFAQFSDTNHEDVVGTTCCIVRLLPGIGYRGVAYYYDQGAIQSSFKIDASEGNKMRFITLLAERKQEKKWVLVRARKSDVVRNCCTAAGVKFVEYNSGNKHDISSLDDLQSAPQALTVVCLKSMCRMGKVVPKEHISFVFEEAQGSNSDTILQSFLGRMCGYGPFGSGDLCIFVPGSFLAVNPKTNLSELERYIRFSEGEKVMPTKASCLKKKTEGSGKFTLVPCLVQLGGDDDEYADIDLFRDGGREQKLEICMRKAKEYIEAHPYTDAIQQEEALRHISRQDEIEVHNIHASTYEYVRDPSTGLKAKHAKHQRWDEGGHWNESHFKMYYDIEHGNSCFYIAGYTDNAEEDTQLACRNPIAPTTNTSVWKGGQSNAALLVHSASDIPNLHSSLNSGGQHTVFIHKSLLAHPFIEAMKCDACKGKGGKNWPKHLTVNRAEYVRIVILITVEITIRLSAMIIVE